MDGATGRMDTAVSDLSANFNVPKVSVGFGDALLKLDPLIRVGNVKIHETAWTARPDVWILPFLDVYGIVGHVSGDADVELRPGFIPGLRTRGPNVDLKLNYE